jgi:hypothetical protein
LARYNTHAIKTVEEVMAMVDASATPAALALSAFPRGVQKENQGHLEKLRPSISYHGIASE